MHINVILSFVSLIIFFSYFLAMDHKKSVRYTANGNQNKINERRILYIKGSLSTSNRLSDIQSLMVTLVTMS